MPLAVLGLGGNLGDREETLAKALDLLEESPDIEILRLSGIYETTPFDVASKQDNYLNCCLEIQTKLVPNELLKICNEIENKLGRLREEYHGARTIDIDILLYEGISMDTEELTIPHKGILSRAFVMIPLADMYPDRKALGLDFSSAIEEIDKSCVWLYK